MENEAIAKIKTDPISNRTLSPTAAVILTSLLILIGTAPFITGYMLLASVNFFLLLTGFTLRKKNKLWHASLMSLGILSDIALVLVLQVKRHATQTAFAFTLGPLQQAHVLSSLLATLLYFPVLGYGIFLLRNKMPTLSPKVRGLHKRLGLAALVFRTLGYFLMFSMLHKN